MSSSQYIKIFNDTVLKQSILQGYEYQRTDKNLGKFTMGELAFTRDTGRVFVGTYTDNKKEGDITPKIGGLLVGNKYFGASNGGKKLTYYPTYNSSTKVYNGDYTFDVNSCSLILFDSNIKNSNTIDSIKLNKSKDDIYNDGFIKMRILEPDGVTIKYDTNFANHNVLKADFKFDRVAEYFGDNWKKEGDTIEIKNIELENNAICKLPSNITIGNKEYSITTKQNQFFPNYVLCTNDNPSTNKINLEFKPYEEVVHIKGGNNISVVKEEQSDGNVKAWKINYEPSPSTDTEQTPDTEPTINETELYNDIWGFGGKDNCVGVTQFDKNGTALSVNRLYYTKYDNNGKLIIDEELIKKDYPSSNSDEISQDDIKNGLNQIKNSYIGELYNLGLNYLKTPISISSGEKFYITEKFFDTNYCLIIPQHAQSVLLQITATNTKVTIINNNITILKQTMAVDDITTVEVPLQIESYIEDGEVYTKKYFAIAATNATVKLLGYRV